MGLQIDAFIPPVHNEALTYMPDDMFEYCVINCDIDMSTFVKMNCIGHWACAQWNMKNHDGTPGPSNTYCWGSLILPNTIESVTWASFFGTEFQYLYWPTSDFSKIGWYPRDWDDLIPIFKICGQLHVVDLYLNKDANGPDWKQYLESTQGGKVFFPLCDLVGPYHKTTLIENIYTTL
jgi:hypothetical protein